MKVRSSFVEQFRTIRADVASGVMSSDVAKLARKAVWEDIRSEYGIDEDVKLVVELDDDDAGQLRYKHETDANGKRLEFRPDGDLPVTREEDAAFDTLAVKQDDGPSLDDLFGNEATSYTEDDERELTVGAEEAVVALPDGRLIIGTKDEVIQFLANYCNAIVMQHIVSLD